MGQLGGVVYLLSLLALLTQRCNVFPSLFPSLIV